MIPQHTRKIVYQKWRDLMKPKLIQLNFLEFISAIMSSYLGFEFPHSSFSTESCSDSLLVLLSIFENSFSKFQAPLKSTKRSM